MHKTPAGKKVFIANPSQRPSLILSKTLQKNLSFKKHQIESNKKEAMEQIQAQKAKKNPSFQYYFFKKHKSEKLLENLRNSTTVKKLCQKQKQKQRNLDQQLKQITEKIIHEQNNQEIAFYKKHKPEPIQNDPQLSEYGLFYNKISPQKKRSLNHRFQKVRQNKLNLSKYEVTRGMVSPQKVRRQLSMKNLKNQQQDSDSGYILGLSPFQFKETIAGRIKTLSSHDLRMDLNKTLKAQNVFKIWYDNNQQGDKDLKQYQDIRQKSEYEQNIKKCHSFDSYKGHKLFQFKIKNSQQMNDNIYYLKDNAKDMEFYKRWKTHNNIDMEKTTDRPSYPQKLGPNLNFNFSQKKISRPRSKKKMIGLSSSERNLIFTRQIINSARGCYR